MSQSSFASSAVAASIESKPPVFRKRLIAIRTESWSSITRTVAAGALSITSTSDDRPAVLSQKLFEVAGFRSPTLGWNRLGRVLCPKNRGLWGDIRNFDCHL